jgi:N-acetyltransferase 10
MIKPLKNVEVGLPDGLGSDWLSAYTNDFRRRMISLLGFEFRKLSCGLAFNFMNRPGLTNSQAGESEQTSTVTPHLLEPYITLFDLKRLESYSKNLVDFHLIMDLIPALARLYFSVLPLGVISLSPVQAAILVGLGLQHKTIDSLQQDLNL